MHELFPSTAANSTQVDTSPESFLTGIDTEQQPDDIGAQANEILTGTVTEEEYLSRCRLRLDSMIYQLTNLPINNTSEPNRIVLLEALGAAKSINDAYAMANAISELTEVVADFAHYAYTPAEETNRHDFALAA